MIDEVGFKLSCEGTHKLGGAILATSENIGGSLVCFQ